MEKDLYRITVKKAWYDIYGFLSFFALPTLGMSGKQIRNICLALCFLVAASGFARQRTEQEAFSIAQQFLQDKQLKTGKRLVRGVNKKLVFKNFYVFNAEANSGFVIVSGDDRTQDILGYAEIGTIDEENLPCNVKWLLDYYDSAISAMGNDNQSRAYSGETKADIPILINTQWGQGEPYNNLCPQVGAQRCITGCVATAMAQVLNYNRWPQDYTATIPSYRSASNNILMPELPATKFDWNNMSSTAIAQLMLYCGQAVRMDYGIGASGAFNSDVPTALVDVFGYSKSVSLLSRDGYSDEEWDELAYGELNQGKPILYFGQSPTVGGHAFIVDGYSEGMYHLNWGWDGYCDGFFILDNLAPTIDEGFNFSQQMVVNVCPPADAGDISRPKAIVTAMTCSERYLERADGGSDFPVFTVGSTVESDLADNATLQVGFALYNDEGLVKILAEESHDFNPADSYTSEAQVTIDASLPQGDYRIVTINRVNDTDEWLTNTGSTTNYVAVTIGETSIQLQPMPKSSDDQYYIDFGVHTIDGITYHLFSGYDNLWARVMLLEEKDKYSGNLYIPDYVSYQNMTFKICSFDSGIFDNSPELVSLSIPRMVDNWDGLYISECPKLIRIDLRNEVVRFGTIYNCPALESITYPQSCSYVEIPVLCNSMKSITFTNKRSIKIIPYGNTMWEKESMPALTDVYFASDIPPTLYYYGEEVSIRPNDDVTIHIPQGTLEVYNRSVWKDWNLVEDQPTIPTVINLDYCGNDECTWEGICSDGGNNDVEFAMRIPEEMILPYKGCRISRIEFYTSQPVTGLHYADVEYVFLTTRKNDYIAKKAVTTIRGTWMSVELDQPYIITGDELFVGIGRHGTLEACWANFDIVEDGFWYREIRNGEYNTGEWIQNCGDPQWNHPLPIRAIIEGESLPNDVVIVNSEIISEDSQLDNVKANGLGSIKAISGKAEVVSIGNRDNGCFSYTIDGNGNRIYVAQHSKKQTTARPKKVVGGNKRLRIKMRNRTPRLVKQVTLDWDIDGNRQGRHIVETAMLTNHEDVAYIDIPNDIIGRNNTVTVSVSSIDGEPDEISANSNIKVLYSAPGSTFFPRKIVMEEATGTWCGYCPIGIVCIEKMQEQYPDNFIAIAVHNNDGMIPTQESYNPFFDMFSGYPTSHINRSDWIYPSPFNFEDMAFEYMKDKGEAMIKVAACSSDGKEVEVSTESIFGFSDNGSTEYRIAYVLIEDNVGPYYQSNFYSNPSAENNPDNLMDWWIHQDNYVETTFNEVARAIYDDYYGVAGSLPSVINEGETYSNLYKFFLPDNIQNKENLKVVALLLDCRTGEILNADRAALEIDASGINQTWRSDKSFDVYNIMGMKVKSLTSTLNDLPNGIYIVNGVKYSK